MEYVLYYHSGRKTIRAFRRKDGKMIANFRVQADLKGMETTTDGRFLNRNAETMLDNVNINVFETMEGSLCSVLPTIWLFGAVILSCCRCCQRTKLYELLLYSRAVLNIVVGEMKRWKYFESISANFADST